LECIIPYAHQSCFWTPTPPRLGRASFQNLITHIYSFPSLRAYFGTGFERGIHRGYSFIEGLRYTSLVVSANQGLYARRSDKIIWTSRLVIQNYCSLTYKSNNLLVKYSPFKGISSLKRRHMGICQYYPILPNFY
jgi:hypothetical protein